ncbi:MAG: hypothetical protein RXR59_05330 [Sulfolobus sp.]
MQILAELHPKTKMEKLIKTVLSLADYDGFDIPDSPMGLPSPLPSVVASVIRREFEDKRIIVNQRLLDVNELFVASLSLTSKLVSFDIAFTQGDKPKIGKEVGYLKTEEAIVLAKKYNEKARIGMMISFRKSRDEIISRLSLGADFYLALRLEDPEQLNGLQSERIIPYIIVSTEKNKEVAMSLNQPVFNEAKAMEIVKRLEEKRVQGVLISTLGDNEGLVRIIKSINA